MTTFASPSSARRDSGGRCDGSKDACGDVGQGANTIDLDQFSARGIELGNWCGLACIHRKAVTHDVRIVVLASFRSEALGWYVL